MIVCRYIDSNQEKFIERLSEAVAIRSVSGSPDEREEVTKMIRYVAKVLVYIVTDETSDRFHSEPADHFVDVIEARHVKFVFFANLNFAYKIRILFELCLGLW